MPRIGHSRPLGSDHSTATSPSAAAISPTSQVTHPVIPSDLDSPPILTRPSRPCICMHPARPACFATAVCPYPSIRRPQEKKTDVKQATSVHCAHAFPQVVCTRPLHLRPQTARQHLISRRLSFPPPYILFEFTICHLVSVKQTRSGRRKQVTRERKEEEKKEFVGKYEDAAALATTERAKILQSISSLACDRPVFLPR